MEKSSSRQYYFSSESTNINEPHKDSQSKNNFARIKNDRDEQFLEQYPQSASSQSDGEVSNEYDDEMMLEQIKLIDTDDEIHTYLMREEMKYLDQSFDYEQLYENLKQKAYLAIKLVKRLLREQITNDDFGKIEKVYNDQMKKLRDEMSQFKQQTHSFNQQLETLQKQNSQLIQQNNEFKSKCEILQSSSASFNLTINENIDLVSLNNLESNCLQFQKQISDHKNQMINRLEEINQQKREENSEKCIICQVQVISYLCKPCNHVCLCQDCILNIDVCPMDRQQISHYQQIFLG